MWPGLEVSHCRGRQFNGRYMLVEISIQSQKVFIMHSKVLWTKHLVELLLEVDTGIWRSPLLPKGAIVPLSNCSLLEIHWGWPKCRRWTVFNATALGLQDGACFHLETAARSRRHMLRQYHVWPTIHDTTDSGLSREPRRGHQPASY